MKDALQQPIVIGKRYGYSASVSGVGSVIIGYAVKLNKTKVTLDVASCTTYLYGELCAPRNADDAKTVSVMPFHLFPISELT